jgi:hypothetical protein
MNRDPKPKANARKRSNPRLAIVLLAALLLGVVFGAGPSPTSVGQTDDPSPPDAAVKLIFIHHSCGENWLADGDGGLGIALRDNNYFVSDTNYGWGPDGIGDTTDVGHWWSWFRGSSSAAYLNALYTEYGQHAAYSRLSTDPGGQNQIVLFKSCYPNSHLSGNPGDAPTSGDNPLRGQDAWSEYHTVANAKGIYNDLLTYFAARQDKLFVAIAAPPLMSSETDAAHAANARAFNDWLVNDWLDGYPHNNVAVFDFYNVLTSNGGDVDTNDLNAQTGNHHRWWNGAVQHLQTVSNSYSAYWGGNGGGSHPTAAGNQKATAEFVPLLNVFYHRWQAGGAPSTAYLPLVLNAASSAPAVRPLPETTDGIHVFNDQLAGWSMTEAQFEFAATHYAGAQKMTRSDADHLRAYNPDFVILHYRLGLGLGYRGIEGACDPTGDWLQIIEGDNWVQEWPASPQDSWFFRWTGERVLNCDWGWYLVDPGDSAWRSYWAGQVLRQLRANDDDGLFADSFSVPNYLGADRYDPPLPALDAAFENAWAARIESLIAYLQQGELAAYHLIPNVGSWVTTRDPTDYSAVDGVMIEGFGGWGYGYYFDLGDWQLQMNRILGLVGQDKAILAQQYIDAADVNDRTFLLACYLLVKGRYTYLNLDLDLEPEWFPEYEIPIGQPTGDAPADVDALWNAAWSVYARTYSNGLALVNPTSVSRTVSLGGNYYRATPSGGGFVPADGDTSAWTVSYTPVTAVTLPPNRAAVLLDAAP